MLYVPTKSNVSYGFISSSLLPINWISSLYECTIERLCPSIIKLGRPRHYTLLDMDELPGYRRSIGITNAHVFLGYPVQ